MVKPIHLVTLLLAACIHSVAMAQASAPAELGGLRVPSPGSAGTATSATFAIGTTTDDGVSWRTRAGPADSLRIVGRARPSASQVGQRADLFLVVLAGSQWVMRNSSGAFVPWSGQVADLVPYRVQETLAAETAVDLYSGQVGGSGQFSFFLGYRATDGVLHYSAGPHTLVVEAASAVGSGNASWFYNGTSWQSNGSVPACPSPLLQTPVDPAAVTSVLYPGQRRGGDYKAHGGFRFDAAGQTSRVNVVSALTGTVYRAARYIEAGVTQYLFDIISPCGVMTRLDHLLELSPRFAAIAATLPPASGSSATTNLQGYSVSAGETIGTAIGLNGNVFLDFGVYDLRARNPATTSQPGELIPYGICWLDALPATDRTRLRSLPAGDGVAGFTSDYCR